jgi:phosphate:Na+ symporter
MGHTLFNMIGVLYMLPLVIKGWFGIAVERITPGTLSQASIMTHLFMAHCLFNVFNAMMFLPFIRLLELIVNKILPITQSERMTKPMALEMHLLNTPVIALQQAKTEIIRMAHVAKRACVRAIEGIITNDTSKLRIVRELEDIIDTLQMDITSYLTTLSRRQLDDEVSVELPVLLHTVNDLERIGDHAMNIVEIALRKAEQKLTFSPPATDEANQMQQQIIQMFDHVIYALEKNNISSARAAMANEETINNMQVDFRRSHVHRMTEGICTPTTGVIFIDLVDNIEKTGDHLTNIAQAIAGGLQWRGVEPTFNAIENLN